MSKYKIRLIEFRNRYIDKVILGANFKRTGIITLGDNNKRECTMKRWDNQEKEFNFKTVKGKIKTEKF